MPENETGGWMIMRCIISLLTLRNILRKIGSH